MIAIAVIAMLLALWSTYARRVPKNTIFHSAIEARIKFPSGRTYRTNRWYRHHPHLEQFEMLVVDANQFHLLSESEESAKTKNDWDRTAEIQIDENRYKISVERYSHSTDDVNQYWISLGPQCK